MNKHPETYICTAYRRQSGSTVVIVLVVILVISIMSFNLFQASLLAIPWKQKYNSFRAITLAENAIILQKFQDQQPVEEIDSIMGDSIIVGSKGFEPDTSFKNISEDMNRILLSSKEILPSVDSDTVGMWLRYRSTGVVYNQKATVTIEYGKKLSEFFAGGLLITGNNPIQGASGVSITGDFFSRCKTDRVAIAKGQAWVNRLTTGVRTYSRAKLLQYTSDFNSALESDDNIFSTMSNYSQKGDFDDVTEIIIHGGDLRVSLRNNTLFAPPKLKRIVVEGLVDIEGTIDLSGVEILASGSVTLGGDIQGKNVKIFSKERIELKNSVSIQGLILAEGDIVFSDEASAIDNSLVITAGRISQVEQGEGSVFFRDESWVHGMVISSTTPPSQESPAGNIYISNGITATGVLFAQGFVDNSGIVNGAVVAQTMSCSGEPHCFGFGTIDRTALKGFYQPIDMKLSPGPEGLVQARWMSQRGEL